MAKDAGVEKAMRLRKQELLFAMLKARAKEGIRIHGEGTLEVLPDGYGFLRYADQSYVAGPGDIYVGPNQIRRYGMNTGDLVAGAVRTPRDNERYFAISLPDHINGVSVNEEAASRILFENLTPLFPNEPLCLERNLRAEEKYHRPHYRHYRPHRQGAARAIGSLAQKRQNGYAPTHRPCH